MAAIFPKNANRVFYRWLFGGSSIIVLVVSGLYYQNFRDIYFSPQQPIAFSHAAHVGKLGMKCQSCHAFATKSERAGLPDMVTCMDCHRHILADSPEIEPLRRAADPHYPGYTGHPVKWVAANNLPGHASFSHQAHTTRGIGCAECHGDVSQMARISESKNNKMAFCLACHRNPAPFLRPLEEIESHQYSVAEYLRTYEVKDALGDRVTEPRVLGELLKDRWKINPQLDCSTCHH